MGRWRLWGCSRLLSDIDPGAHDVIRRHGLKGEKSLLAWEAPGSCAWEQEGCVEILCLASRSKLTSWLRTVHKMPRHHVMEDNRGPGSILHLPPQARKIPHPRPRDLLRPFRASPLLHVEGTPFCICTRVLPGTQTAYFCPSSSIRRQRDQPPLFLNFLYCGMSWKISEGSTGLALSELGEKQEKALPGSALHRWSVLWSRRSWDPLPSTASARRPFCSHSPISPGSVREGGQVSWAHSRDKAVRGTEEAPPFYPPTLPRDSPHWKWRRDSRERWERSTGKGSHDPGDPIPARTLQGLPSTVCSSNSSPTLKLISVVRTVVEVLM